MGNENIYRMVAAGLLVAGWSISILYRHRANRSGGRVSPKGEGTMILALRSIFGLVLWLSALIYLINPGWMAWSSLPLPAWLRWGGASLMAICVPLVYWVMNSLGKNITPTVAIRDQHSLVTEGPYRWVRHPLYTVGFVFFIGFSALSANWFIAANLVITFFWIGMRTPVEEARLIEEFGEEYRHYMARTGRYLPRINAVLGQ